MAADIRHNPQTPTAGTVIRGSEPGLDMAASLGNPRDPVATAIYSLRPGRRRSALARAAAAPQPPGTEVDAGGDHLLSRIVVGTVANFGQIKGRSKGHTTRLSLAPAPLASTDAVRSEGVE